MVQVLKDKAPVLAKVWGEARAADEVGALLQAPVEIVCAPTAERSTRISWERPVSSSNAPSVEPQ